MECSAATFSPATILVVDNEDDIRNLFALVLEQAGHTVIMAPSGAAAVSVLTTTPLHLVLTDYDMPDMRGDHLITVIRAQRIPVKTVLASGHPQVAHIAARCGADGCFRKGDPLPQLLAMVTAVLETPITTPCR